MKVPILPITAQDYRELPEGGPRYQLIEGDEFSCRFFPGLSILTTKIFPPAL